MSASELSAYAAIKVHASPADVCRAFVSANEMSRYWFTRYDDGLREGEASRWFVGDDADAMSFEVHVKELRFPHKLVVDWPGDKGELRQVTWSFEASGDGGTLLSIEETGFAGGDHLAVSQALDSTRGFNQVIVAAKAFVEFGIQLNVVADHV